MNKLHHNIPPIYNEKSKILILGSFPSPKSRENEIFYGNPQNRFWKVLSIIFNEPTPVTAEDKTNFLYTSSENTRMVNQRARSVN